MQGRRRIADQHSDESMRRDRVLLSALIFSAAWHFFWLSALTVVVAPKDAKPLKFSSISFLGPILEHRMLEVSPAAHERSIPEKGFLSEIESLSVLMKAETIQNTYTEADLDTGTDILESDETLTGIVMPAIDGNKMEPGNSQ